MSLLEDIKSKLKDLTDDELQSLNAHVTWEMMERDVKSGKIVPKDAPMSGGWKKCIVPALVMSLPIFLWMLGRGQS